MKPTYPLDPDALRHKAAFLTSSAEPDRISLCGIITGRQDGRVRIAVTNSAYRTLTVNPATGEARRAGVPKLTYQLVVVGDVKDYGGDMNDYNEAIYMAQLELTVHQRPCDTCGKFPCRCQITNARIADGKIVGDAGPAGVHSLRCEWNGGYNSWAAYDSRGAVIPGMVYVGHKRLNYAELEVAGVDLDPLGKVSCEVGKLDWFYTNEFGQRSLANVLLNGVPCSAPRLMEMIVVHKREKA